MKVYNNRTEYLKDVELLNKTIEDLETRSKHIDALFYQWKYTSPDSPWYDERKMMESKEKNAVKNLIKISDNWISSEWCGEHILFKDIV
tara:strand:+ start:1443 stop:1709 length:267 start_codon:yes stop_codon:yes gene_type:complete